MARFNGEPAGSGRGPRPMARERVLGEVDGLYLRCRVGIKNKIQERDIPTSNGGKK
jgi:hypothetical protein